MLSLAGAVCLAVGCSDDSTGPDDQGPAPGEQLWSARFGDGEQQIGYAVAVDAWENMLVAGSVSGSADFGGGVLTSAGQRDFFVAKFGPDGSHVWSKRFGDANDQYDPAIAVDVAGDVILAGGLEGTIDFGGGALTHAGWGDVFVAKFGSDGTHVWSKRFGDGDVQKANAVAVDASGNVIVAGILRGVANFGGGSLTSAGINDVFVAKFTSAGAHVWSKRFGDASNQFPTGVAVDASGHVAVAGTFQGTINFGGGSLTSGGDTDIFLATFGSDGAHLWSKRFGDASSQSAEAVAVDASGNLVLTGGFQGNANFGGSALTSAGGMDVFVARFGPDGNHLWSARFGDGAVQLANGVAADASGNAIIAGRLEGATDFGGGALTSAGGGDLFVAKFGAGGAHIWSKRFGDVEPQMANGVAVDASGNAIGTGYFLGTVDFGGGALTCAGGGDVYVVKLAP